MAQLDQEEKERRRQSLYAALAATGLLGTVDAGSRYLKEKRLPDVANSRSLEAFKNRIQSGDVLVSRSKNMDPIYNLMMNAVKGDIQYHTGIVTPNKTVTQAWGKGYPSARTRLRTSDDLGPHEFMAYRPKNQKSIEKALEFAKKLPDKKVPYPTDLELLQHGVQSLAGIPRKATGKMADVCKGGSCGEIVAHAYPKEMKNALQSVYEIKANPNFELVAKYSHIGKPSIASKIAAYGVHPLLKNLKWGALLGAGAYGLDKILADDRGIS